MVSWRSLAELLSQQDLAECVLCHLPLAALAAVQCTCRAARAAVAQLPEACWQASWDASLQPSLACQQLTG